MQVRFFDPGLSYRKIKTEIDAAMRYVLDRGDLILRGDVAAFEENLADYLGVKHVISVASGTDALVLSLKAAGVEEGDRVACPSYTFRATAEAIHHARGIPVLYDIGEIAYPHDVHAIVVAHIAGNLQPRYEETIVLAQKAGVPVIEDSAQAIGAAPLKGLAATYSFYPAKILGCYGDGGAIATNDDELAKTLMKMRNHYKDDWSGYGYNSRLDNLQAAVLNIKLKYLPEWIIRRKQIATMYDQGLKTVHPDTKREIYQDYIIALDRRDELFEFLKEKGIETMKNGYPFPSDLHKGFLTQQYEARSLRLPCNPDLTDQEVQYVIDSINEFTPV